MKSETLNQIAELCGHQAAILLTRAFGGRHLSIPTEAGMHDQHPIALIIGLTAARKLAKARARERIEIPSEMNAILELRNAHIIKLFEAGTSIRAISFDIGLSRKWVRSILLKSGYQQQLDEREQAARN